MLFRAKAAMTLVRNRTSEGEELSFAAGPPYWFGGHIVAVPVSVGHMVVAHYVAVAVGQSQGEGQRIFECQYFLAHSRQESVIVVSFENFAFVASEVFLVYDFGDVILFEAREHFTLEIVACLLCGKSYVFKRSDNSFVQRVLGVAGKSQPGLCFGFDKLHLVIAEERSGTRGRQQSRNAIVSLSLFG